MLKFWNPDALPYVIDWSAWATFVAGIAAVIGAIVVGLKQAGIAREQASIADRQAQIMARQTEIASSVAETEATRLRYELYETRVKVYEGIANYIAYASNYSERVPPEIIEELYRSMASAPFVLGDDVAALAKEAFSTGVKLRVTSQRLEAAQGPQERLDQLMDAVETLSEKLATLRDDLRRTMAAYLRLTRPE
jgi:hypothetical protein